MRTSIPDQARRGRRRRWSAAEKARLLRRFATSGLGPSTFCRVHGLSRKTFSYWRRELSGRSNFAAVELPLAAVEVIVHSDVVTVGEAFRFEVLARVTSECNRGPR